MLIKHEPFHIHMENTVLGYKGIALSRLNPTTHGLAVLVNRKPTKLGRHPETRQTV